MFGRRKRLFSAVCALVLAGCGGDIAKLQADGSLTSARLDSVLALPMGVYVEGRTIIQAPPDSVWVVFSDFNRWQGWNAGFIRAQTAEGDALEWGLHFTQTYAFQPVEVTVQSVILRLIPGREAVWKSTVFGLFTLQAISFHPAGKGRTEVVCRERLAGLLALLFRDRLRAEAQGATQTVLEGLRVFCEARYPVVAHPAAAPVPSSPPSPVPSARTPSPPLPQVPQVPPDTTGKDTTAMQEEPRR